MTKRLENTGSLLPSVLSSLLLEWYDKERRILPWREDPTPYHVWVSEIMLQQTRVEAVIPYYERFLAELPDVPSLADASEDRLLKLWEGLGYYSRVRNMQKAARQIMEIYGGEIPSDPAELVKLAGIGPYTAAAVASIAYQIPAAAIDGNLLRIYARLTAYEEDIRTPAAKKLAESAFLSVLPEDRPGDMNQALMDLGAVVCLPNGVPLCDSCPLRSVCTAHVQGLTSQIPKAKEKKARPVRNCTVLVIRQGDSVLLHKRPKKGLLAGLYEFPNPDGKLSARDVRSFCAAYGLNVQTIRPLAPSHHIFTHLVWEMTAYEVIVDPVSTNTTSFPNLPDPSPLPKDFFFIPTTTCQNDLALPSAFSAYTTLLYV